MTLDDARADGGGAAVQSDGAPEASQTPRATRRSSSSSSRRRRTAKAGSRAASTPEPEPPTDAASAVNGAVASDGSDLSGPTDEPQAETVVEQRKPPARRRSGRKRPTSDGSGESSPSEPEATAVSEPVPHDELATEKRSRSGADRQSRRGGGSGRRRAAAVGASDENALTPEATVLPEEDPEKSEPRQGKTGRSRAKQPAPAPDSMRARIAIRRGLPELVVGEKSLAPTLFFGNIDSADAVTRVQSQVRRAAKAGVVVHSTLLELVCPMPPDDTVYATLDDRVEALLDACRQGFVMPRIVFVPSSAWREQYPNEMQSYARGVGDDPSIASDHFWGEAERSLRLLIEHVRRTSYGDRVIGYHLERGEWFQPADAGFDRSYANREGFRRWLREKYGDNEVALRAAWYDGTAQFYTAEIPAPPAPAPGSAFFDARRERRWIDFMEYTSDITVDRLIGLARTAKEATDGRALVSVCYGYTWDFAHSWSGHLALGRLLECPHLDVLTGPTSYSERAPGSSGALPAPCDSVMLHGKLWAAEDDTKTHLAGASSDPDPYNPRMENRDATEAAHRRTVAAALAHQTGIGWMDLWGEGWLDSDDSWKIPAAFVDAVNRQSKVRRRETAEVIALIDERSLCHFNGSESLMQHVLRGGRESLMRSGASTAVYLQSDVTHKDFPTDAKLYVFLNPYRLPDDQREAIRSKLRQPGQTLVWMYSVGSMTDRSAADEPTPDLVGLSLRPQSWNAELGTRIVDTGHAITQTIADGQLGTRMRLNPSYFAEDDTPGMVVLGEYAQSGLPSLALRTVNGCSSVFCGEPVLTPDLLRGLCRHAGVHLYTRAPEDYVQVGYGWLGMHVLKDGNRTLQLPEGCIAYDIAEDVCSAPGSREYRTSVRARTTRLFCIAPPDSVRKLGFDPGRVRAVAPSVAGPQPTAAPPASDMGPVSRADDEGPGRAQPEVQAIMDALPASPEHALLSPQDQPMALIGPEAAGESASAVDAEDARDAKDGQGDAPEDASGEALEAAHASAEGEASAKRRRRRGGRGRGRRRKPAAQGGAEASAE